MNTRIARKHEPRAPARHCFPLIAASYALLAGAASARDEPLSMNAEMDFPSLGIALKLPSGLDPGKPKQLDFLGNEGLGFYFGLPDAQPVKVWVETWAAFGDLDAFCRRRVLHAALSGADARPQKFDAPGFDEAARAGLGKNADGFETLMGAFRKGRTIVSVTVKTPAPCPDAYTAAVGEFLAGIRCIASDHRPIAAPDGWRTIESASFELRTCADEDVGAAFLSVLEAALTRAKRRFPSAGTSPFRRPCLFFSDAQAFAAFKEKHSLGQEQSCVLLPEQRVIVAGVLPFGKQSRRFARAEIDVFDAARSVFDLFAIEAAGTAPEPWFTEGLGCLIAMALGSDLQYSEKRAEDEMGAALSGTFRTGKALPLEKLFALEAFDDDSRCLAAAWSHFLAGHKLKSGKPALEAYMESFAQSWDGKAARSVFEGESFKSMSRTLGGRVAFWASRAKRGR